MSKHIAKSKTFWFNLAMGLLALADLINPSLLESLGVPKESHHQILTITGSVVALVNIYLRMNTDIGVKLKK